MVIRTATLDDVPAVVEMGLRFLRTTPFGRHVHENPAQTAEFVTQLIEGAGAVFVAETGGPGLIGMLGLLPSAHPVSGELFVTEIFWYVEPAGRGSSAALRLLREGEEWTREIGGQVL